MTLAVIVVAGLAIASVIFVLMGDDDDDLTPKEKRKKIYEKVMSKMFKDWMKK